MSFVAHMIGSEYPRVMCTFYMISVAFVVSYAFVMVVFLWPIEGTELWSVCVASAYTRPHFFMPASVCSTLSVGQACGMAAGLLTKAATVLLVRSSSAEGDAVALQDAEYAGVGDALVEYRWCEPIPVLRASLVVPVAVFLGVVQALWSVTRAYPFDRRTHLDDPDLAALLSGVFNNPYTGRFFHRRDARRDAYRSMEGRDWDGGAAGGEEEEEEEEEESEFLGMTARNGFTIGSPEDEMEAGLGSGRGGASASVIEMAQSAPKAGEKQRSGGGRKRHQKTKGGDPPPPAAEEAEKGEE